MCIPLVDRVQLDLGSECNIDYFFNNNDRFDFLINCAAYTAVDNAEEDKELANQVNHLAVKKLADIAKEQRAILIHISTDYVFDGACDRPYAETCATSPFNVYGETKLAGEKALQGAMPVNGVIIRTSWLYSEYGNNFVKTMLKLGAERAELNIVSDQVSSPTYAADLAWSILVIIECWKAGQLTQVYHYSNKGDVSWYEFAEEIVKTAEFSCKVHPIKTLQYPTPAKRPRNSSIEKGKILKSFDVNMLGWKQSLKFCLRILRREQE